MPLCVNSTHWYDMAAILDKQYPPLSRTLEQTPAVYERDLAERVAATASINPSACTFIGEVSQLKKKKKNKEGGPRKWKERKDREKRL